MSTHQHCAACRDDNNTLPVAEARRLTVEGYAIKFCAFVDLCEQDCYALDITREQALAMIDRAAELGDTLTAFFNEASGMLCIG